MKNIFLSLFTIGMIFFSCKEEVKKHSLEQTWKEIENGNYQLAEEYCNQILASSDILPIDSLKQIYLARNSARVAQNKWKLALEDCKYLIELGDTSNSTKNQLGQIHFWLGNYVEAIQIFHELADDNFKPFEAYFQIGDIYRMNNEKDSAYKYFTTSIEIKPLDNALAYNRRGRLYSADKVYEKALLDFDSAISQLEGSEHQCLSYTLRGEVYYQLEEIEKALNDFNKSIELCQDLVSPYYHIGFIYEQQGKNKEALENYKNAIELDSTLLDIYWNMINIYNNIEEKHTSNNREEVIFYYSKILEIEPKNYIALERRGLTYAHLGKYQKSLEDFNEIIKANELEEVYKAQIYELRGITYLNLDNDKAACNDFYKSVSLGNQEAQRRIDLVCK